MIAEKIKLCKFIEVMDHLSERKMNMFMCECNTEIDVAQSFECVNSQTGEKVYNHFSFKHRKSNCRNLFVGFAQSSYTAEYLLIPNVLMARTSRIKGCNSNRSILCLIKESVIFENLWMNIYMYLFQKF